MDESVFDVLDELEHETNIQYDGDFSTLRRQELFSEPKLLSAQPTYTTQENDGNRWPHEWEIEWDDDFPLDDFGMIR